MLPTQFLTIRELAYDGEDRKMDEHLTKENCSTSVSCGPTVLSLLHFTAHSNKEKERSPLIVGGSFSEGNNS